MLFLDTKKNIIRGWNIKFSYKFNIFLLLSFPNIPMYTLWSLRDAGCRFYTVAIQNNTSVQLQKNAIECNHSNETPLAITHRVSFERSCNDYTFQHVRVILAPSMSSTTKITLANICGPEQSGAYLAHNTLNGIFVQQNYFSFDQNFISICSWWPNWQKVRFGFGPVFCLLLRVISDYTQPVTGQVTEVTCPMNGRA